MRENARCVLAVAALTQSWAEWSHTWLYLPFEGRQVLGIPAVGQAAVCGVVG